MLNRRAFLGLMPVITPLAIARVEDAVRALGAARPPAEAADDEDFWRTVQSGFDVDRSLVNLNNGGVSPTSRLALDAFHRHIDASNEAPVYTMWRLLDPRVETVRRRLAGMFGCRDDEIAITRNASESLENLIFGLDLKPGDEVLTTVHDYPRMLSAWRQREARDGIVLKQVAFPTPPPDLETLVRTFAGGITARTRVILVSQVTFTTGQIFPVKEICALGRERGIEVIVDGAHAFAHYPFTHQELGCDYYGTSLHKWLMAPIGTGMLYVRKDKIKNVWPLMAAAEPRSDDIRKFEEIGTHPAANRLAIAEAIQFHEGLGAERKAARLRFLRDRLLDRIERHPAVRIYTSRDPAQSCAISTVGIEGIEGARLASHLFDQHRIIVAAIDVGEVDGIRITPSVYTTPQEVDSLAAVLEDVLEGGLPD